LGISTPYAVLLLEDGLSGGKGTYSGPTIFMMKYYFAYLVVS
jgi:hypothetical protein